MKPDASNGWRVLLFVLSLALPLASFTLLMALHVPLRADLKELARLNGGSVGRWSAMHVLATNCGCSQGILRHLVSRGTMESLHETVLLIGLPGEWVGQLRRRGFAVRSVPSSGSRSVKGVNSVPWLVFHSPAGEVKYAGGYTALRSAADGYADRRIWRLLRQGETVAAMPAYGCAISRDWQQILDPLGLKRSRILDAY